MFTFCKPISSKKRFSPFRKLDDRFSFTLYERASAIPAKDWSLVTEGRSVFLEKEYLAITEGCTNSILHPRYIIVYENKIPCGVLYFQIVDFKAELFGELLSNQLNTIKSTRMKMFESYIGANKNEVLMRLFTCGNNLVSGEYGFIFSATVSRDAGSELLLQLTDIIAKEEKLRGSISAVLLKDFEKRLEAEETLQEEGFTSFLVEPNMVVNIPPGVKSLEDYIAGFSKKYRNRAKNILKAGAPLEKRELSAGEIEEYERGLYSLYSAVYDRAKFRLLKLPENYFSAVKKAFPDTFFVSAFFLQDQPVAFSSYFLMPDRSFEAHYIGLDYAENQEFELYQNLLYHNIATAVAEGRTRVNLGRTAAEIKTTVGARAQDLICYAQPQNTLSRIIMKPFISFLQPGEWTPRNPFREEN